MILAPNPVDVPAHELGFGIVAVETGYSSGERPKLQETALHFRLTVG
ncbi:MAG: hypothetical protein ABSD39_22525 [Terriglobales bacterium]